MSIQDLPQNMETRVRRAENCGLSTVRRVAAMLDLNQNMFLEGAGNSFFLVQTPLGRTSEATDFQALAFHCPILASPA